MKYESTILNDLKVIGEDTGVNYSLTGFNSAISLNYPTLAIGAGMLLFIKIFDIFNKKAHLEKFGLTKSEMSELQSMVFVVDHEKWNIKQLELIEKIVALSTENTMSFHIVMRRIDNFIDYQKNNDLDDETIKIISKRGLRNIKHIKKLIESRS